MYMMELSVMRRLIVLTLDLKDSYNRVDYAISMRTLVNIKFSPLLITWISNTMLKRKDALRLRVWASDAHYHYTRAATG